MTDAAHRSARSPRAAGAGAERRVGRFEIISGLSATSLGALSLARIALGDEQGRVVQLRRIDKHPPLDDGALRQLRDACQAVQKIRHPRVIGMLEVRLGTSLLVADEYVEGETLYSLMRKALLEERPFELRVALRLVLDALLSTIAARRALVEGNVVRSLCGLSPDSLLVATFGEVMIADLGLATLEQPLRVPELIAYRCPVQLGSRTPGNEQTEVYSLGVVLWELLANKPLFGGGGEDAVRQRILAGAPEPPSHLAPGIRALLAKAVDPSPMRRFDGLEAMARAIRELGPGMLASNEQLARALDERCHDTLEARRQLLDRGSGTSADEAPLEWRPTFKPAAPNESGAYLPLIEHAPGSTPPFDPELEAIDFELDGSPTVPVTPAALATHAAFARGKPDAKPMASPPAPVQVEVRKPDLSRMQGGQTAIGPSASAAPGDTGVAPSARGSGAPGIRGAVASPQSSNPPDARRHGSAAAARPAEPVSAATGGDRAATGGDRAATGGDRASTGGDRAVKGGDRAATGGDRAGHGDAQVASRATSESTSQRQAPRPTSIAAPRPASRRPDVSAASSELAERPAAAGGAASSAVPPELLKPRAPMASSDGLEKYAVALPDPATPVERAKVEQVSETVIINDGSLPERIIEPPATFREGFLNRGDGDSAEREPADTTSSTLPPARISRVGLAQVPGAAIKLSLADMVAQASPSSEAQAPRQRTRWLGLSIGAGALLALAAFGLVFVRLGGATNAAGVGQPLRPSLTSSRSGPSAVSAANDTTALATVSAAPPKRDGADFEAARARAPSIGAASAAAPRTEAAPLNAPAVRASDPSPKRTHDPDPTAREGVRQTGTRGLETRSESRVAPTTELPVAPASVKPPKAASEPSVGDDNPY